MGLHGADRNNEVSRLEGLIEELLRGNPELRDSIDGLKRTVSAIAETFRRGGILYVAGNGGSFADAVHIKGELAKSFIKKRPLSNPSIAESLRQAGRMGEELLRDLEEGLPVVVLGESHSLRSAYANDRNPDFVYAQELNSFASHIREGAFLGISTSGNANNVLSAAALARAYGLPVIGFTGPGGGELSKLADIAWKAPGDTTHRIQEYQVILYHAMCILLEEILFPDAETR